MQGLLGMQPQAQQQGNLLGNLFQTPQQARNQSRNRLFENAIAISQNPNAGMAVAGGLLGETIGRAMGRVTPEEDRAMRLQGLQGRLAEQGLDPSQDPHGFFTGLASELNNMGMQGEAVQAMMQAREFAPESVATERVVSGDTEEGQRLGLSSGETAIATVENGNVTGLKDRTAPDSPDMASKIREYQQAMQLGLIPPDTTFNQFRTATVPGTGPQFGSIPPGMQMVTDPETGAARMEPIPGGPAEREREISAEGASRAASIIVDDFNFLLESLGVDPETGETVGDSRVAGPRGRMAVDTDFLGSGMFAAGTPTGDFLRQLDSVKSTIAVDQLLEIKRQGSGLGAVPARQLEMLSDLLGTVDAGLSDDKLKENLYRAKRIYRNVVETSLQDVNDPTFRGLMMDITGGRSTGAGAPAGVQPNQVIDWSDL